MKKPNGGMIAIGLTTILLFLYYGYYILHGDHIAFSMWGDGYKNYYTLVYYLRYDDYAHFTGMNYPFGENIVFTDNQPAFAWLLKLSSLIFPSITNHIHGFITWTIFAGIIITAFIVYHILLEFEVGEIHAALFATFIALLSPQIQRLHAHFSLSHTYFIPLLLYLTVRFFKTAGSLKFFILITLTITFFAFVHVYYLAIAGLFILLLAFFVLIFRLRQSENSWQVPILLTLSAVIPFVIFKLFMFFTDSIADRPKSPWGFIESRSTLADIFTHPYSFTGEVAGKYFTSIHNDYHFEGMGYIGFVCVISLFGFLVTSLVFCFKKQLYINKFFPFNYFVPAAFTVLLFAMAFPFCIPSFEKFYNLLPVAVKQFRAAGRFNWIFYYTATIFSAVLIYNCFVFIASRNKFWGYLLFTTVCTFWFVDVNMISNRYRKVLNENHENVNESAEKRALIDALKTVGKSTNSYQAIFPLPLFLNGSERLLFESGINYDAMKTSLYSGLPIAGGMMSRTSQQQTFQIARLLSDDIMQKDILDVYKSNKPLLMLYNDHELKPQERKILERATYLFRVNNMNFYELPLSAFANSSASIKRSFTRNKDKYFNHGQYISSDSISRTVFLRFENEPQHYTEFGRASFNTEIKNGEMYYSGIPNGIDNEEYEISLWVYADDRRAAFPIVYVSQNDEWGNELEHYELDAKRNSDIFGKWIRVQTSLKLRNRKNRIRVSCWGAYASFDELMIRAKNESVISDYKNDSTFMFNNFPIR